MLWAGVNFGSTIARLPLKGTTLLKGGASLLTEEQPPAELFEAAERVRLQQWVAVRWKAQRIAERAGAQQLRVREAEVSKWTPPMEAYADAQKEWAASYALLATRAPRSIAQSQVLASHLLVRESEMLRACEEELIGSAPDLSVMSRDEFDPIDVSSNEALRSLLRDSCAIRASAAAAEFTGDVCEYGNEPQSNQLVPTAFDPLHASAIDEPNTVVALAMAQLEESQALLAAAQSLLAPSAYRAAAGTV